MDLDLDRLITGVNDATDQPLDRVSTAALLRDQLEHIGDELIDHFVSEARGQGCSWAQIGEALGVTRQAAQQRHSALADRLARGVLVDDGTFKRFTGKARAAVENARAAAQARNHGFIGTEHVLLGLFAAEDGNVAVQALGRLGADRAAVERLVDERVPPGDDDVTRHIPFTPRAKLALERALREALMLGHNYIGTEHIVLALRKVEEGVAAQVLADLGVAYDDLRTTIVQLLLGKGPAPTQT
jgi:ATP-dependent Clp protease ATP-binding subunit ClpA